MLATAQTCAVIGLDGLIVQVEVDISPGLPAFNIVGLPDTAVQESRERVRAALRNSGCEFPLRRITVNLAPADLKKAGPAYDLPIAVGILLSSGQLHGPVDKTIFLGELSLDGSLRHTTGILAMVSVGRQQGFTTVYVPTFDAPEAALMEGIEVFPTPTLTALIAHLRGESLISPIPSNGVLPESPRSTPEGMNLAHVKGQEHAKRALEVAAAGFHNLLFNGPPGSGKTLLARCLPSILPRMSPEEALEVTKVYSVSGALPSGSPLVLQRPFRAPHYTISNAGLVGGGRTVKPGEITLSHRGVLFLDELPEFNHTALESLRQPLEDKLVTISRVSGTVTYPASFMAVAQSRRNSSVLLGGRVGRIATGRSACRRSPTRAPYAMVLKEERSLPRPRRPLPPCRGRYRTAAVERAVRSPGDDRASGVGPPHRPTAVD